MPTLEIRADRRRDDAYTRVVAIARQIEEGVEGLSASFSSREDFDGAPDQGAFRDFVHVVTLRHERQEALDYAAEWLVDELDWIVDVGARPGA